MQETENRKKTQVICSHYKYTQNQATSQGRLHQNRTQHFHLLPTNHLDFFSSRICRTTTTTTETWASILHSNTLPVTQTMVSNYWRLRSASTEQPNVPTCRRSTIGGRAFPVTRAKVWNSLPSDVTSASSLLVFKNRLKTYLFRHCYETVWLWITFLFPSHYLPARTVVLAIVFTF